jgi:hypothetical protein
MFPLPRWQPKQPPVPEFPLGPAKALSRAINECCRTGPITVQFLNGHPKAIVARWFGDLDRSPESFDPEFGDGDPHYTEPGCDLWQDPLPHMTPENYRMAVPFWLIQATDDMQFRRGQGTVLFAGHLYPLHNAALVDYYKDGIYQARRYYWDSEISPAQIARINLDERLNELKAAGAYLGTAQLLAPEWRPRQGTAAR